MAKWRWSIGVWRPSFIVLLQSNLPNGICSCRRPSFGITPLHILQQENPHLRLCLANPLHLCFIIWMGKPWWIFWLRYSLIGMRLFVNSSSIWVEPNKQWRSMLTPVADMSFMRLEIGCMWSFNHIGNSFCCLLKQSKMVPTLLWTFPTPFSGWRSGLQTKAFGFSSHSSSFSCFPAQTISE